MLDTCYMVLVAVVQLLSHVRLLQPMDCSLPGSSSAFWIKISWPSRDSLPPSMKWETEALEG